MRLVHPKPKKFWSPALITQAGGHPTALGSYTSRGSLTNSSSLTLTGAINLGASTAQLYVVGVAVAASATISSVTIGGNSLSAITNAGNGVAIYAGVVALNGSQTVTAVCSTGQFNQKGLEVWAVNGLGSTAVKNTGAGTGSHTITVNTNDLMFSVYQANAGHAGTYTSSSQSPAATYDFNGTVPGVGGADWTISSNNASFTVNPTVSGGSQGLCSASWV